MYLGTLLLLILGISISAVLLLLSKNDPLFIILALIVGLLFCIFEGLFQHKAALRDKEDKKHGN